MTTLWRCCKRSHLADAFSGKGGRQVGGRWHTEGRPIVYTSDEASLSLLQVLVHGWSLQTALQLYALVSCEFPDEHIHRVGKDELPEGWDSPEPSGATQTWGDRWLDTAEHPAIRVPSAIIPGTNVLVNPLHPLAAELAPAARHIEWDPRLRTIEG